MQCPCAVRSETGCPDRIEGWRGMALSNEALEEALDRFDELWRSGRPPQLAEFVESLPIKPGAPVVAELVAIDLEYRWKTAGSETVNQFSPQSVAEDDLSLCPRVTDYAQRWPELAADRATLEWLAAEEFRAQLRWGSAPDEAEFVRSYGDSSSLRRSLGDVRQEWELDNHPTIDETAGSTIPDFSPSTESTELCENAERDHRYQIQGVLGEGGMGKVFLAYDRVLGRKVAIKIPRAEQQPAAVRERFRTEVKLAARLRHPGICPIYDAGDVAGRPYLTMAYIEGRTLQDLWRGEETPSPTRRLEILAQVATAMKAAHQAGIVHRDLKPSNIMLDAEGRAVVTDFGLARLIESEDERLTRTGDTLGSPAYMSPEQVEGPTDRIGLASDIYSLGVILYESLTGCLPFCGRASEVHVGVARDAAPAPSTLAEDVDPELDALCVAMLSKAPRDRPRSMQHVAASLTAIRIRLEGEIDPRSHQPRQPRTARNLRFALAMAAIALLVVGVAIRRFSSGSGGDLFDPLPRTGHVSVNIARDSSGDESNLTASPAAPPALLNSGGAALCFDGIDDYVLTPVALDASRPFTIEAWVAPADPYGKGPIVSNADTTGIQLRQHYDEQIWSQQWSSLAAESGQWVVQANHPADYSYRRTHVASVWDGKLLTTYVNGRQLPGTSAPLSELPQVTRPLLIAAKFGRDGLPDSSEGWFHGAIDEVHISETARYDAGFTPDPLMAPDKHTLALYRFDEPDGELALDSGEHGNHATIYGATRAGSGLFNRPGQLATQIANFEAAVHRPVAPRTGPALSFARPSAEVRLAHPGVDLSEPFTMEVWVTPDAEFEWRDWKRVIIGWEAFSLNIQRFHNVYAAATWSDSRGVSVTSRIPGTARMGLRTHVAFQWTGSDLELYVNGHRAPGGHLRRNLPADDVAEEAARVFELASKGPLVLGRRINGKAGFGGEIDRFRLSVGTRYSGDFEPDNFMSDEATAVLYDFHEGEGELLHDISGNERHAVIDGAAWVRPRVDP